MHTVASEALSAPFNNALESHAFIHSTKHTLKPWH